MRTIFSAIVTLLSLLCGPVVAFADVHVSDAWSRATPPGTDVGVAYFQLHNMTPDVVALVAAQSPVAERAEMHKSVMEGGVMKMAHQHRVEVDAGAKLSFGPGGYHVMLMGLAAPLVAGQTLELQLIFADGASTAVTVEIKSLAESQAMSSEQSGHTEMSHDQGQSD